eukprot:9168942-Pyramimonas_sp.AAC.1
MARWNGPFEYAWYFGLSWASKPSTWKFLSETARRSNQRLFARTAACKKQLIIASVDINMAFLSGSIDQELVEATGENDRV